MFTSQQAQQIESKASRLTAAVKLGVSKAKDHPKVQRTLARAQSIYNSTTNSSKSTRLGTTSSESSLSRHYPLPPTSGCPLSTLPLELLLSVFALTDPITITQLRLVNSTFNEVILAHQTSLASSFLRSSPYSTRRLAQIFPTKKPTFQYLHTLKSRHTQCQLLARHLALRSIHPMYSHIADKRHRHRRRDEAVEIVTKALTPPLYQVLYFLLTLRLRFSASRAVLAAETHGVEPSAADLAELYRGIQEQLVMDIVDDDVLLSVHHAFTFLVNTLRAAISPERPWTQNDEIVAVMLRSEEAIGRCLQFLVADELGSAPVRLRREFMMEMEREKEEVVKIWKTEDQAGGRRRTNSMHSSATGDEARPVGDRDKVKIKEVWFEVVKKELGKRGIARHQADGVFVFEEGQGGKLVIGCPGCVE